MGWAASRATAVMVGSCMLIALYMAGCREDQRPMDVVPDGWQQIQLGQHVTFFVPPELQPVSIQPVDSTMALYRSESCELVADYGRYADPLDDQAKQAYAQEQAEIDARQAKLVSFVDPHRKDGFTSIAAVHFPRTGESGIRLTIQVACRTQGERDAAKRIFQTVRFP